MKRNELSAIVLAAGLSRRAQPSNKLLLERSGKCVIRSVVEAVECAGFGETLVVVGHAYERIEAALQGLAVRFVYAPEYAKGMGHSLAAGIRASKNEASGFVITVGDLPELRPEHVGIVADAFIAHRGQMHCIPICKGQPGHPVVLGAWLRPELEALEGDSGAKALLKQPDEAQRILNVSGDPAMVADLDEG